MGIRRYVFGPLVSFLARANGFVVYFFCCRAVCCSLSFLCSSSNIQAFAIFITHTSFQLYHSTFTSSYLRSIHNTQSPPHGEGTTLRSTRLYDFCDPVDRAGWLDILIALVEYLRTGESRVGYLNRRMEKNMLHGGAVEESGLATMTMTTAMGEEGDMGDEEDESADDDDGFSANEDAKDEGIGLDVSLKRRFEDPEQSVPDKKVRRGD